MFCDILHVSSYLQWKTTLIHEIRIIVCQFIFSIYFEKVQDWMVDEIVEAMDLLKILRLIRIKPFWKISSLVIIIIEGNQDFIP